MTSTRLTQSYREQRRKSAKKGAWEIAENVSLTMHQDDTAQL